MRKQKFLSTFFVIPFVLSILLIQQGCRAAPCASGKGKATDQELIAVALSSQTRLGLIGISGDFASIQGFLRENPDCCSVSTKPIPSLRGLFSPKVEHEVHIVYKITPEAKKRFGGDYYEVFTTVSECGSVIEESGQQLSARETPPIYRSTKP